MNNRQNELNQFLEKSNYGETLLKETWAILLSDLSSSIRILSTAMEESLEKAKILDQTPIYLAIHFLRASIVTQSFAFAASIAGALVLNRTIEQAQDEWESGNVKDFGESTWDTINYTVNVGSAIISAVEGIEAVCSVALMAKGWYDNKFKSSTTNYDNNDVQGINTDPDGDGVPGVNIDPDVDGVPSVNPYLEEPSNKNGTLNIGAGTRPTEGAYNIDNNPSVPGVQYGTADNLTGIPSESQSQIIIENPYKYDALTPEVNRVLEPGGTIKISGGMSNRSFNKYYNLSDADFSNMGYDVIYRGESLSTDAGFTTTGDYVRGKIMELILQKK